MVLVGVQGLGYRVTDHLYPPLLFSGTLCESSRNSSYQASQNGLHGRVQVALLFKLKSLL